MKRPITLVIACLFLLTLIMTSCQGAFFEVKPVEEPFEPQSVSVDSCSYGGELKRVEAVDQYTVRFELCYPDSALPAKLAFPVFAIQDQDVLTAAGGNSLELAKNPNGSGPYVIEAYDPGQSLLLKRNPSYWGVKPNTEQIEFRWSEDALFKKDELLAGNVDGIDRPSAGVLRLLQNDSNANIYYRPSLNVLFVGMNNRVEPFNDQGVRLALGYAIDSRNIVTNLFTDGSVVAEQLVPNSILPGFTNGLEWYDTNSNNAQDLINESGFDFSKKISLAYVPTAKDYLPNPAQVAQEIREELRQIGVDIKLVELTEQELFEELKKDEIGMFLYGVSVDFPDASNFYDYLFLGDFPYLGNSYPEIEESVRLAAGAADERTRQQNYDETNRLIKELVPIIPVAHGRTAIVFRSNIQGVVIGPMNENIAEMSNIEDKIVIIQSSEPVTLWPSDETDQNTFRVTSLLYDTLVKYAYGETSVKPNLAEYWISNDDLTEWTFNLRFKVYFQDGKELDANDVVATFSAMWNEGDPNHRGRTGDYEYFKRFFGEFKQTD